MKITFDPAASADLDSIFAWISRDSERAAYATIARIEERILTAMTRPGITFEMLPVERQA